MLDASIIVPTFNERANLEPLVSRLQSAASAANLQIEVLIVDDASLDGTLNEAKRLSKRYPVRAIARSGPRSLSLAVLDGIALARSEIVLVMDADLSHPPEALADLVAALRGGDDFVIGSRFVSGGSTADAWGKFRRLNSWVASLLAWPLTHAADPMAGYFATWRRSITQAKSLSPIGYKIGLELLVKCAPKRVREVPIHFEMRERGESKLSLREQLRYLRHLFRLYVFTLKRRTRSLLQRSELKSPWEGADVALPSTSVSHRMGTN